VGVKGRRGRGSEWGGGGREWGEEGRLRREEGREQEEGGRLERGGGGRIRIKGEDCEGKRRAGRKGGSVVKREV